MASLEFFIDGPPDHTMAPGIDSALTEIGTKNISWRSVRRADTAYRLQMGKECSVSVLDIRQDYDGGVVSFTRRPHLSPR